MACSTTVPLKTFDSLELPCEIWQKILLFTKASFNELLELATISRGLRKAIVNKWFLEKYNKRHPILRQKLLIYCNFSNVIDLNESLLYNVIPTENGGAHHSPGSMGHVFYGKAEVHSDPLFDHILRWNKESIAVRNRFWFKNNSSQTFTISFWFFLTTAGASDAVSDAEKSYFTFNECEDRSWSVMLSVNREREVEFDLNTPRNPGFISCDLPKQQEPLCLDVWHHVTIRVYSSSSSEAQCATEVYINGGIMKKFQSVDIAATGHIVISTYFIDGGFADLAVWTRKLTLFEIQSIYRQRKPLNKTDFVESVLQHVTSF